MDSGRIFIIFAILYLSSSFVKARCKKKPLLDEGLFGLEVVIDSFRFDDFNFTVEDAG
jgi:hypothetical protein